MNNEQNIRQQNDEPPPPYETVISRNLNMGILFRHNNKINTHKIKFI